MRLEAPELSIEGGRAVLGACFVSDGELPPTTVHLSVAHDLVGVIDVTATPFLPIASVAAAALGEDLVVDTPVDPAVLSGARQNTSTMAGWWAADGWRAPRITANTTIPLPADAARGHGLFFSRGVDGWASLLGRLADPQPVPVTHLLAIEGVDRGRDPDSQERTTALTRRVAAELGLPLVDLATDVRDLLDRIGNWEAVHGSVLAGLALLFGPLLGHVTVAGSHSDRARVAWGSHLELDGRWSSSTTTIEYHLGHTERLAKVGILAQHQLALDTLLVCWTSGTDRNCGRCPKCVRTMTALSIHGALDRCPAFDEPLDVAAVWNRPQLLDQWSGSEAAFTAELVDALPPGDLRVAWERDLDPTVVVHPLDAPATPALAGLELVTRVNLGLAGTGHRADPEPDARIETIGHAIRIGWEPGMVALRPPAAEQRRVLAHGAANGFRPLPWVVAELVDPERVNDPWTVALTDRAEQLWGPGLAYLAGIGWADAQVPVLPHDAVGRLLLEARVRLWWRAEGTLDPLRVVESVEHGCLPVQVMPAGAAARLRGELPDVLAEGVTDLDGLAALDLAPGATRDRFVAVVGLVAAGSADRDLALAAVTSPGRGDG